MRTFVLILSALVFVLWLYLVIRPAHFPKTAEKIITKVGLLLVALILLTIGLTI